MSDIVEAAPKKRVTEKEKITNAAKPKVDPLIQTIVVRKDLSEAAMNWPIGAVMTQACHASVGAIVKFSDDAGTQQYTSALNLPSMHKVVLSCKNEAQLLQTFKKLKEKDIDAYLWVEQPENIPTALATKPVLRSIVNRSKVFKKLRRF